MRPVDFWGLSPLEFRWLLEVYKPVKMYGKMSEAEVAELYAKAYGDAKAE